MGFTLGNGLTEIYGTAGISSISQRQYNMWINDSLIQILMHLIQRFSEIYYYNSLLYPQNRQTKW